MRLEEVEALGQYSSEMIDKFPNLDMLEIGAWKGMSTVALSKSIVGSKKKIKLYSIDPHEGFVDYHRRNIGSSYEEFCENIKIAGVDSVVSCIKKRAEDVEWDRSISLLFIDGLHHYKDIKHDFEKFVPWVVNGGLILIHDFGSGIWPEVKQYILTEVWPVLSTKRKKRFAQRYQFEKKARVKTMLVLEKIHG
jgi:predicted O-methyltransferase YrrM